MTSTVPQLPKEILQLRYWERRRKHVILPRILFIPVEKIVPLLVEKVSKWYWTA